MLTVFIMTKQQLEPHQLVWLLMAHGCSPPPHSVLLPDSSTFSRILSVRGEEDRPMRGANGTWGGPQEAEVCSL